jgi:CheY-like chemotaxis protein
MASILLIDDSELVQQIVSLALATQGHRVTVARDMRHGVRRLRDASFDLILMDLNMPEVRGEAGVRLLRQRLDLEIPIIILSGEITKDTISAMAPLKVNHFVAKGEDFEVRLNAAITQVLGEKAEGS